MAEKSKKNQNPVSWLQNNAVRVSRAHFGYVLTYMISIVVFDSWNLYTHEAVSDRWTLAGGLLVLTALAWFLGKMKFKDVNIYTYLVMVLVAADIAFAGLNVYWERGLASKSVILFVVPLIAAATLRSRSTLLAAAAISAAVYSTAAVRYFYQHYGESYRVELYGYIFLYVTLFFVFSWLLWIVVRPTAEKP